MVLFHVRYTLSMFSITKYYIEIKYKVFSFGMCVFYYCFIMQMRAKSQIYVKLSRVGSVSQSVLLSQSSQSSDSALKSKCVNSGVYKYMVQIHNSRKGQYSPPDGG